MNWGDYLSFEYGKPVADKDSVDGLVPVFGTNGQIGTSHLPPLCKIPSFIVGRKGAYRGVHYSSVPFSVIDTGFYALPKTDDLDLKWAYYKFLTYDINRMDSGSAIPSTDRYELYRIPIELPSKEVQHKVVSILDSFETKIKNNSLINQNLYDQLTAYYNHLFSNIDCSLTVSDLSINVFSGGTPSTSNEAYWNGDYYWLSSGETSERFIPSTIKTITEAGIENSSTRKAEKYDIVIASAGQGHTRGQTSMLLTDSYVNQSTIVVHATKAYLPYLFWNISNRYEELRVISNSNSIRGSLTTKMINSLSIPKANENDIKAFSEYAWPIIYNIENNLLENMRLTGMRDVLLPKLMSGELDVSEIKV